MKNFRDMVEEFLPKTIDNEEEWTKEDLIELLDDLDEDDLAYVTDVVLDILSYEDGFDWEEMQDTDWSEYEDDEEVGEANELSEKMSAASKKDAAKKRKKPAFKKAQRLKKKCMSKYGDKVRKTAGTGNPVVCGTDGKLHKGMKKADKRKLAKSRKKNKNKIVK